MKRERGTTLVEISVGVFLLSILLLVVVQVMIPAMRAWSSGQKRAELAQGALLTAGWIGDDIERSSPDSIRTTAEGLLVMRCALGQREDHTNEFTELVVYRQEGEDLYRFSKTADTPEAALHMPSPAELATFDSKRKVASGVELFGVTVVSPWRAELHLKLARDGRSSEIITGYSSMYAPFDPNVAEASRGTLPRPRAREAGPMLR